MHSKRQSGTGTSGCSDLLNAYGFLPVCNKNGTTEMWYMSGSPQWMISRYFRWVTSGFPQIHFQNL